MHNGSDVKDDGLYDLIMCDESSDDDMTVQTKNNMMTPRTISLNAKAQSNLYTYLNNSSICLKNGKSDGYVIPYSCPVCNMSNTSSCDWCINCGEFLIRSTVSNEIDVGNNPLNSLNNSPELNNSYDESMKLDLSSLQLSPDKPSNGQIAQVDLDIDILDTSDLKIRQNDQRKYFLSQSIDIPKLNLNEVMSPTESSRISPEQKQLPQTITTVEEKENQPKRHWASSSLEWKFCPDFLLKKKPSYPLNCRTKLGFFTNQMGDMSLSNTDNNLSDNTYQNEDLSIPAQSTPPNGASTTSKWLYLPSELWSEILSYVPISQLCKVQLVCRRFYQIGRDRSLWRSITLNRNHVITDRHLLSIADKKPQNLHFKNCTGKEITLNGLREMLVRCGHGIRSLSFISCSNGAFGTDHLLSLAAQYCPNITRLNASYLRTLQDQTLIELSVGLHAITHLSLMGASTISNKAIKSIVDQHCSSLVYLDLYACFHLNTDTLKLLESCRNLRSLALGSLKNLQRSSLISLLNKLPHLTNLDLRGTMRLVDTRVMQEIGDLCPRLHTLVLANSSFVTSKDVGYLVNGTLRKSLCVLDLCGCDKVSDEGLELILQRCFHIEDLDISCTGITGRGNLFDKYPPKNLKCLRMNNNKRLKEEDLVKIIRNSPKLKTIYLCGSTSIVKWDGWQRTYPHILFKHD